MSLTWRAISGRPCHAVEVADGGDVAACCRPPRGGIGRGEPAAAAAPPPPKPPPHATTNSRSPGLLELEWAPVDPTRSAQVCCLESTEVQKTEVGQAACQRSPGSADNI